MKTAYFLLAMLALGVAVSARELQTFDKIEKELEDFFHKESPEVAPAVAPVVSPVAPPVNVSGSRAVPVSGARVAPTPLPAPVPAPLPSPDTHKWELPSKDDLIAALSG
ncbi:hypothetical protein ACKKBG_A06960 [Auxenochlorella protothecoides x Auxenochlorella symbiontica]|uniref:Uncharacterized protein n=1 Tax=Auxenochlorella protothecoides TaxID=3075 RepID=A0A1D2A6A5_AUXPR